MTARAKQQTADQPNGPSVFSSRLVTITAVAIVLACGQEPTVCTSNPRFAVSVRVRDAITRQPAAFGAVLVLREAQYADSATGAYSGPNEEQASLLGAAEERPGTYDVTVRKVGYQTWTRQQIVVRQGKCGVDGVTLEALLVRATP